MTSKHKRNKVRPGSHVATQEHYVVTLDNTQNKNGKFMCSISSPSIEFQERDIDKYLQ
ncbi:hypothetical protein Godav_000823 [Gossypium davidsonii]|uniref:Uncharacterized protein n=2 Tax=Gossypium TaxID=3633 RepID=A0A7J8T1B4_GOSDV|nr:hypothetical protein [Gossypium davidsonii]MBA0667760.1 hypothetical protein [Gossypium klotzschianum]